MIVSLINWEAAKSVTVSGIISIFAVLAALALMFAVHPGFCY